MSIRLQILLCAVWGWILIYLLNKIRKKQVKVKMVLHWLFLDVILIVLTVFPSLSRKLADFCGIETPSNMLFFFGLVFLTMICFSLSIMVSTINGYTKELAQKVALNEYELMQLKQSDGKQEEKE